MEKERKYRKKIEWKKIGRECEKNEKRLRKERG